MGRRSIALADRDRWIFNRLADSYGARPGYPRELPERLLALAGGAGARVVDVGAGTGHLALPLADGGVEVVAVEPAREMLSRLEEARARRPGAARIRVVHAAAESTGLDGDAFDLALLSDALQWVDPELAGREAGRLVRTGGVVAVVEATFAATPFMERLAASLARANPKTRHGASGALRQFLSLATGGARPARSGALHRERFLQDVPLDDAGLVALLASFSHVGPALGPARLEALVTEARALARAAGGARFTRDLTLHWAVRRRRAA